MWGKRFLQLMVVACAVLTLRAGIAHAIGITNFTIALSSHEVAAATDTTMTFVTATGVDASGDTIVLTWGGTVNLTALSMPTDVDFGVDNDGACDGPFTQRTLAASAAAGVWGVAKSGQNITFTPPTDAGLGEVPAGNCIEILVGQNATSQVAGSNRIVNPGTTGSYTLAIAGAFGDSGMGAASVMDDSSIGVTAKVVGPSTSDGDDGGIGGGGGTEDVSAPLIYNVQVTGITETSATVSWLTDESATSRLDWGRTTNYEIGVQTDGSLATSHSMTITNLIAGVSYVASITATDSEGNAATYQPVSFTTLDTSGPIISDLQVNAISTTSATVQWITDEAATTVLSYGLTTAYELDTMTVSGLSTDHTVILTGLEPGTVYYVQARSADAFGNEAAPEATSFTTRTDLPPTNVVLTVDANTGETLLSWQLPSDPDLDGVVVVFRTDRYPTSPTDGTVLFNDLGTSYLHTGTQPDQPYYYGVFVYDLSGQYASGSLGYGTYASVIEPPVEPPVEPVEPPVEPVEPPVEPIEEIPEEPVPPTEEVPTPPGEELPPTDGFPPIVMPPGEVPPGVEIPGVTTPGAPEPTAEERIGENQVRVLAGGATVVLTPRADGTYDVLQELPFTVEVLGMHDELVSSAQFIFNGGRYLLAPPRYSGEATASLAMHLITEPDGWRATVQAPASAGEYGGAVTIAYDDGSEQAFTLVFDVLPFGVVLGGTPEGGTERLENARVEIFTKSTQGLVLWDAIPSDQSNPVVTGASGAIGWYVPTDDYVVRVKRQGYFDRDVHLNVGNNVINPTIALDLVPVLPESVALVALPIMGFQRALQALPAVQTTLELSTPVLVASSVGVLVSLATAFNLLPLLQYGITSPFLFLWRRKRKDYGIVYNAYNKLPIDLAIVRLERIESANAVKGRIVQTRVTDTQGRYFFLAQPGLYRLRVAKAGFSFPSKHVARGKQDAMYLDVYHTEPIEVREKDAIIAANIPMDPVDDAKAHEPARIVWRKRARQFQHVIAVVGLIAAIAVACIQPAAHTIAMAGVQLIAYLLVRRLATSRKPKSWGIVYDKRTGKKLSGVVIRLFDPTYNKLIETSITDRQGRYSFLLGPGTYYSSFEKSGYEHHEIRPIDFTAHSDLREFAHHVSLKPVSAPR